MFKTSRNMSRLATVIILLTVLLCTLFAGVSYGEQGVAGRGVEKSKSQDPQSASKEIDENLSEIFQLLNQGESPGNEKVSANEKMLQRHKKHLKSFADDKICQYYMLFAWNKYFNGDQDQALKAAKKAYTTEPANNDAHITEASIAILTGQKPMASVPKKKQKPVKEPKSKSRRKRTAPSPMGPGQMGPGMMGPGMGPGQMGPGQRVPGLMSPVGQGFGVGASSESDSTLNLDVDALNIDLLGRKIEPLELECINSTSFSFDPSQTTLCAIFWQLGSESSDSNDTEEPAKKPAMASGGYMGPGMMGPGQMGSGLMSQTSSYGRNSGDPLSNQMAALGDLFASKYSDSSVKFVAINIDDIEGRPAVIKRLLSSPWPWAQVIASESANSSLKLSEQFAGLDTAESTLVIAGNDGTITYAGPAAGFLAPMVLKKKPTSNLKSAEGEKKIAQSPKDSTINTNRNQPRTKSTEDEKKNIQSPKNTAVDAVKTRPRIKSTPDFLPSIGPAARSLEDINPQAEKEIEYARGFLKTGRFTGYKKGIDLCRDVLRDYPDTKYADQARDLLKTVPERYQKRYNVTDEEMGL